MNEQLSTWLASDDPGLCHFREGGNTFLFFRLAKSPDFDYLFCERRYNDDGLTRDCTFEYAGIYCRKDGLLYDEQYELKAATHGTDDRSAAALLEQLKQATRRKVEAAIGNDRSNLTVTEITDAHLLHDLEYLNSYSAKEMARQHYLDTIEFEAPAFRCHYGPDRWSEQSLLDYILDPEGYADKEAAAYIAAHQEDMLYTFLQNDAVLAEYQAILADTDNPVHYVKRIMAAMAGTSAKSVNVTICKDGIEFTFKTEAHILRGDCRSYYSTWNMTAADRREFQQLYGRNADYYPQEILKITYARNVLYQKA